MKVVYVGKEGSGKTLLLGLKAQDLVYRNEKLFKKTGIERPIVTNISFSDNFIAWARTRHVPIRTFRGIGDLAKLTECDLLLDEIGAYFDARSYADLPLEVRLWVAQAQKLGVHIFASCQDWAQVDVSFRRLTNEVFQVRRVFGTHRPSITMPNLTKYPWVLYIYYPVSFDSDSQSLYGSMFDFVFACLIPNLSTRTHFAIFDTNARVENDPSLEYRHLLKHCTTCGYQHVVHK